MKRSWSNLIGICLTSPRIFSPTGNEFGQVILPRKTIFPCGVDCRVWAGVYQSHVAIVRPCGLYCAEAWTTVQSWYEIIPKGHLKVSKMKVAVNLKLLAKPETKFFRNQSDGEQCNGREPIHWTMTAYMRLFVRTQGTYVWFLRRSEMSIYTRARWHDRPLFPSQVNAYPWTWWIVWQTAYTGSLCSFAQTLYHLGSSRSCLS